MKPIRDPLPWMIDPAQENNPENRNLREEAERWIAENPAGYDLFLRFAREALRSGRRFGAKELAERVRWEARMTWKPDDDRGFKINNNHVAYIARALVEDVPGVENLMRFRGTRW